MAELDSIQLDIEELHNSVVVPVERLPVADKCNLAVTSERLERKLAVAPLCTMAVEPNDTSSTNKKKIFFKKDKGNFIECVVLGGKKIGCAMSQQE